MSRLNRKWASIVGSAIAVGLLIVSVTAVLAVTNLGLFELDRNALDGDPAVMPDDWKTLYDGGGSAIAFTTILADVAAPGDQFQGGGSKDNNNLNQWLWKPGEPLDKDDITNAYAAAYTNATDTPYADPGDLIIYFGLDRYANNGSAQVGFWFLQDPNAGPSNIPAGGGFKFNGTHLDGDVLVQSNFTQGGTIDSVSVFEWQGGALVPIPGSAGDCANLAPGADAGACATVNQLLETAPWPYTPKTPDPAGPGFPQGSFFEGGINITKMVPDAGCFTGFLAETRSSTPFDSRLKDLRFGDFNLCSVTVDKTGPAYSKAGDAVDWTVTITNNGGILLYKDDITDSLMGDIAVNGVDVANSFVQSNTCGATLAPGASCTITLQRTTLATDPDPLLNTATVVYRGRQDLGGTAVSGSDGHSVDLLHPAFKLAKDCKAGTEPIDPAGQAVFTITFNNTGDADLHVVAAEGGTYDVPAGQSRSYEYSKPGPFANEVVANTETGTVTLASGYALTNSYPMSASGDCEVAATARVKKITLPPGGEAGWTFNLKKGGVTVATAVTTNANYINFNYLLGAGSYTIEEVLKPGWNFVSKSGCEFTVTMPADSGKTFSCDFTNQRLYKVIVIVCNEANNTLYTSTAGITVGGQLYSADTIKLADLGSLTEGAVCGLRALKGKLPTGTYDMDLMIPE